MVNGHENGKTVRQRAKSPVGEPLKVFDLFSGAGGLSIGLEMAGLQVLFALEISPTYATTLSENHPHTFCCTVDIRDVSAAELRKQFGLEKGALDLIAGGPPCQGFSINAPIRSSKDGRNHLFLEYLRFVEEFRPKFVLIENVPGIVSFSGGDTVRAIQSRLKQSGYSTGVRILYAPNFGIPQMRWRTFVLGTCLEIDPMLLFPVVTHKASGRANFTTRLDGQNLVAPFERMNAEAICDPVCVDDAISDLPPIPNGGGTQESEYTMKPQSEYQKLLRKGSKYLYNHECAGLGKANLVRLPHIPKGGSWRDIPHDLLPAGMKRARRSDHTKRYGRLDPKGIASTILTKCDPHWGTYIHPHQDRILSVREAARIQSFPDWVRFCGAVTEQYEQVGNAVPPLLARAIGQRIRTVLEAHHAGKVLKASSLVAGDQLALGLAGI